MTKDELTEYCNQHEDAIYVRIQVDGKWGARALSELEPDAQIAWIERWHERGQTPSCVYEDFSHYLESTR